MAQMPALAHMLVERIDSLLRAHILCLLPLQELLLAGFANRAAVLQIHEAAARGAAVANGHPGGGEDRVAGAQEELVVVDPRAEALRHVVAQEAAAEHHFFVPAGQGADERAERGVGEEGAVGRVRVNGVEEGLRGLDGGAA